MNEHVKIEMMNIILSVIVVMSCFFAGFMFIFKTPETEILIPFASAGLLTVGVILSQVRAVPTGDKTP